jgi:AbrB family looped-hinge helix DNA binding protein
VQTKISTKGQVVLPGPLRRRLNLRPGDSLEAAIENGKIVLTPPRRRRLKARVVTDAITGLPVLDVGPNAPTLTSEEVAELLATFP